MPAIASIAINDGQGTPVTHTYNPVQSVDPAIYNRNGDAAVPVVGEEQITIALRQGGNTSDGVARTRLSLRVPVLETPSGGTPSGYVAPPRVAYYLQANVDVFLPNRSTLAQRKDLRVLLSNLLLNAQVVSVIDSLERPY